MSNALSAFIVGSINKRVPRESQRSLPPSSIETNGKGDGDYIDAEAYSEPESATPENSDHSRLLKIFRRNGDKMELEDPRLKERSKLDKAKRITYLFLYAHGLEERHRVPRSDLTDVLTKASVYDGNTRYWIKSAISKTLVEDGYNIGLNAAGRDEARKILINIFDPSAQTSSGNEQEHRAHSAKAHTTNTKESVKSSKVSSSKRSGKVANIADWVKKWKDSEIGKQVNGYEVIKDRPVADKAIFALWAIRKAVGDDGKIVSRWFLSKFIYEAFDLIVAERNLERALKTDAKGKVLHISGTKFQIQPDGMKYAEEMIKAKKTEGVSSSRKNTAK
ncbi:MAG: hypothetical protein WBV94_05965 [Blastocatellia bacterium]